MSELAECLGLDLTEAFAGHRELLVDLFKCVIGIFSNTETHLEHTFFAWR